MKIRRSFTMLFIQRHCAAKLFVCDRRSSVNCDVNSGLTTFDAAACSIISSEILWKKSDQYMTMLSATGQ
jgi:hypothetical protein